MNIKNMILNYCISNNISPTELLDEIEEEYNILIKNVREDLEFVMHNKLIPIKVLKILCESGNYSLIHVYNTLDICMQNHEYKRVVVCVIRRLINCSIVEAIELLRMHKTTEDVFLVGYKKYGFSKWNVENKMGREVRKVPVNWEHPNLSCHGRVI